MAATPELLAWHESSPRVRFGDASDKLTLAALTQPFALSQMTKLIELGQGVTARSASLTAFHYTINSVISALVAPIAYDRLALDLAPHEIGVEINAVGDLNAVWVASLRATEFGAPFVGMAAWNLLRPIADLMSRMYGFSRSGLNTVMYDSLELAARRMSNMGEHRDHVLVSQLLSGVDFIPQSVPTMTVVEPDYGPAVSVAGRRICCVLTASAGAGSCPTCPLRAADDRMSATFDWLAAVDADDFLAICGRARVI